MHLEIVEIKFYINFKYIRLNQLTRLFAMSSQRFANNEKIYLLKIPMKTKEATATTKIPRF